MGPSQRHLVGAQQAHDTLLAALDSLTDDLVGSPSLLPGWTVGHVVAHIARNADSHVRILRAASRGEVVTQYEGGMASRAADIERDARRPADEHRTDVQASATSLEREWAAATDTVWAGHGVGSMGDDIPCTDLVFRRWREVTVHHGDLGHVDRGLGLALDQWPPTYVREELQRMTTLWAARRPMGLTTLPAAALAVPDTTRLAWLLGRADISGLAPAGIL